MAKKFEEIAVDDQLELPASSGGFVWTDDKNYNPDRIIRVAIATRQPTKTQWFLRSVGAANGKPRTIRMNC